MEMTSMMVWLILLVVFLLIEIMTVGLTCIWFAGGALAGLLLDLLNVQVVWQIVGAVLITSLLLVFTKPFVERHVNKHHEKTNYEELIGKIICITETVDNIKQSGMTILNGNEWTVRSVDNAVMPPGTMAKVIKISGVKLLVEEYKEEM